MVVHDVNAATRRGVTRTRPGATPGALLVARLHVDLCRLASAICPRRAAA
ncbi:putative leader peptide [Streptomyces sp. NPDC057702]